jgi:hypothetical protein
MDTITADFSGIYSVFLQRMFMMSSAFSGLPVSNTRLQGCADLP